MLAISKLEVLIMTTHVRRNCETSAVMHQRNHTYYNGDMVDFSMLYVKLYDIHGAVIGRLLFEHDADTFEAA